MHVFRVMISCFLAVETVLLMDMANTAFFGYYMCALAQLLQPPARPHLLCKAWLTQMRACWDMLAYGVLSAEAYSAACALLF